MDKNQDNTERPSGHELTPHELAAMDALLSEAIGGKMPPDLESEILRQYHQDPPAGDGMKVAVTPVSRSQRRLERRRKSRRSWAIVSGLAVAASLAALIWARPDQATIGGFAVSETQQDEPALAKSQPVRSQLAKKSDPPGVADPNVVVAEPRVAEPKDPELIDSIVDQSPVQKAPARTGIVLNVPTVTDNVVDQDKQETRKRRLRTPPAAVKFVSKTIESDFRNYWKSSGVRPTAQADSSEVAKRLSLALGVNVPASALANHDSALDWLSDKKVGTAIGRTWWRQVTGGNFDSLSRDSQKRLQDGFSRHLEPGRFFNGYLFRLINRTDRGSSDFYTSMVPASGDATHPDMIANLASLTMNVDVSCTRCHDSMIGGNHGQEDYWGFAATIDRGLKKENGKLVRVTGKPSREVFYETMDRRGQVAQAQIPNRWLGIHSSDPKSKSKIDSISDWSVSLKESSVLAEGVVNSLWRLVHGRPLSGQAAHPMSAPMSDELMKVQQDLVDDLVSSGFDIRRTLSLILMSPTTRRSAPESLRDVWATDQSESHKKAIVFAGALPATRMIPMAVKVDQSMRAIGSVLSVGDRGLLAQAIEGGMPTDRSKVIEPLAWDFPDQADVPPVQWLQTVPGIDAKIAHLCYLGGLDEVPEPIRRTAAAMQKAGVDEPTLLHRVWWMAQGK